MTCDCVKMQTLLQKSNTETSDVMETFKAISSFSYSQAEAEDTHYFEVQMMGVAKDSILLEENVVWGYLSETAPVDFDSQRFGPSAQKFVIILKKKDIRYPAIKYFVEQENFQSINLMPEICLLVSKLKLKIKTLCVI